MIRGGGPTFFLQQTEIPSGCATVPPMQRIIQWNQGQNFRMMKHTNNLQRNHELQCNTVLFIGHLADCLGGSSLKAFLTKHHLFNA